MLSNKVRGIMTRDVMTVGVRDKVFTVIEKMAAKNVGAVVVMENGEALGIFTEQDVLKRVISRKLDTKKSDIKRVMTTPVRSVGEETHIVKALGIMYRGKFRHLLVRGEGGAMIGVISMRDILKLAVELGRALPENRTIGSIVSRKPVVVDASESLMEAIKLMVRGDKGYAAVMSKRDLIGIFTERDVLTRLAVKRVDLRRTPVRKLMTVNPVTMPLTALVGEVLAEMYEGDFRHMPVRDDKGNLAGVVSMGEVLRYAKALDVDEGVRKTWKEVEEFWESHDHYTPG